MTPIDGNDMSQSNFTPCVRTVHADENSQLRTNNLIEIISVCRTEANQNCTFPFVYEVIIIQRVSIERKCPYMKKLKG